MSNLKELKNRISSVKATQKITRAMQMVAASKLRRAQQNMLAARPYASAMEKTLQQVVGNLPEGGVDAPLFSGNGKPKNRYLIIALSAQRGLCGSFNTNIARRTRKEADSLLADGKEVTIIAGGRKASEQLRSSRKYNFGEVWQLPSRGDLVDVAVDIAQSVSEMYRNDEFDVCKVVYAEYINVLTQKVMVNTLVPWVQRIEEDKPTEVDATGFAPSVEIEPEAPEVLSELLERNLRVQIAKGLLENAASEQGARMTAMDAATRNAGEMIDKLTLTFNRSRQAIITNELIEIISGAEAV